MRFTQLQDWLDWQQTLHPVAVDLKLERIAAVADRLQWLPVKSCVITVAGTNGKGSTVAILEAILLAAGYRVGCYTSPHLCRYNERIRINRQPVTDAVLCTAFEAIDAARHTTTLSYFEFGTLAALHIFSQSTLDVLLLEVGMGGRLDAVNIVPPQLAIITTIDLDHTEYLGTTREQIGTEKAGIFRAHTPAVCGDIHPPASIAETAQHLNAPLWQYQRDFHYTTTATGWQWHQATQTLTLPYPNLAGPHQLQNASTALMALHCLQERLPIPIEAYSLGLQQIQHPGRLQTLVTPKGTHLLDVAHNPEGARALATALQALPIPGKTYALFSALSDKDIAAMLAPLAPLIDTWLIAPLQDTPRATTAPLLIDHCQRQGLKFRNYPTLTVAYQQLLPQLTSQDRVVIFGSFHTVAECLPLIQPVEPGE